MAGDHVVYLDHNATTPVDPEVVAALTPYLAGDFGNPSSAHGPGRQARAAVDLARERVAGLIGAAAGEITFTGSGSESNMLAVHGVAMRPRHPSRDTIVLSATEHPSVTRACEQLHHRHGVRLVVLPVDRYGIVDLVAARAAVDRRTLLVTVQLANGETGTIQPVAELADIAHAHGALIHTDACQAAGKIPVAAITARVDLLSLAGHKMYAPKGVAALYHRAGLRLEPVLTGGGQESGLRGGTENVPYVAGLGVAAGIALRRLDVDAARIGAQRDWLHDELRRRLGRQIWVNGHPELRLPNTLNIGIAGIDARAVLAGLPGIAASVGSACHAGSADPSAVLSAIGQSRDRAGAAMRLSLGRTTSEDDLRRAVELLATAIGAPVAVT